MSGGESQTVADSALSLSTVDCIVIQYASEWTRYRVNLTCRRPVDFNQLMCKRASTVLDN